MQTVHTPTTSLKEKQRHEREELIIQAAAEVFQEKGYYDASMEEIAARVGISKGTIYAHFPGKEEMVAAIFKRNTQTFLQGIDAVIEVEPTPRAKLEALLQFVYTGLYSKQTRLLSSMYNGVDLKRMIAYSSVNHMGYTMLGIAAASVVNGPGFVAYKDAAAIALNGGTL